MCHAPKVLLLLLLFYINKLNPKEIGIRAGKFPFLEVFLHQIIFLLDVKMQQSQRGETSLHETLFSALFTYNGVNNTDLQPPAASAASVLQLHPVVWMCFTHNTVFCFKICYNFIFYIEIRSVCLHARKIKQEVMSQVKVWWVELQSDVIIFNDCVFCTVTCSSVLGVTETRCALKRSFDLVVYYLFSGPLEADRSSRGLLQKDSACAVSPAPLSV